jgi:hypothetical protein
MLVLLLLLLLFLLLFSSFPTFNNQTMMTTTTFTVTSLLLLFVIATNPAASTTATSSNTVTTVTTTTTTTTTTVVKVVFYGESKCPYCRKFVTEVWPEIWNDVEGLRSHVDYDFIPWGNAYFATSKCGDGPYSSTERECWYRHCQPNREREERQEQQDDDCYSGQPIYQHGEKEGIVDIYETCIKKDYGLDHAVAFTYCAEGSIMDNDSLDAEQIMRVCTATNVIVDSNRVQTCYQQRGKQLEIENAKQTPVHPGVPYVVVDGTPVDNPMDVHQIVCDTLKEKMNDEETLPDSCKNTKHEQLQQVHTIRGRHNGSL